MKDYWSDESIQERKDEWNSAENKAEREAKWDERNAERSCSSTSDCDQDSRRYTLCCNSATITNPETNESETINRCMSQAVAEFNSEMSMGKYDVTMGCTDTVNSGAKALAAGALALVAASLY